jgi:cytochrome c-type biogenesis protein CcmF
MIPELGEFSLILALAMAGLLSTVPVLGVIYRYPLLMNYALSLSVGLFVFVVFSFCCLGYAFATDDFSVAYVASHSNSLLPLRYKLSAVWGGHEGSMLLWVLILSCWTLAVGLLSKSLPQEMLSRVLAVMGMVATGFLLFVLFTSSPFTRYLPDYPQEGMDLNPLLQDVGLILHPPMLYMGYVGFVVAFAFAIAALSAGRLDAAWARWSRPWTIVAWCFLSLGIVLGSWWAYYELGWGGWWFWDPVENASFMPWLVGTALIHSLAASEKRAVFKRWTILLAIFTFSLSIMGTFLVRSGVLTSVHAFASDPARGLFMLGLLGLIIGSSLILYAFKAADVRNASSFSLFSRESLLLVNNVLLTVVCMTILLGTLYPLLLDALGLGKISVGPPYFNSLFIPFMALLALFMGLALVMRWRATPKAELVKPFFWPIVFSVIAATISPWWFGGSFNALTALGTALALWIISTLLLGFGKRLRNKKSLLAALQTIPGGYYGMLLAHFGVAVTIIGITLVSLYGEAKDIRMAPGDNVALAGYQFKFLVTQRAKQGPNYQADQGMIEVSRQGRLITVLKPEKRIYNSQGSMMTEAAIDPGLFRDLYVALGEPLAGDIWAVRLQYKPYVRWIWLGGLMMALGGVIAALDKRYRKQSLPAGGSLQHV